MALSTGARASDSSPKPITVDALHSASDSNALRIGATERLAFEEQRVVRTDADHGEQAHDEGGLMSYGGGLQ